MVSAATATWAHSEALPRPVASSVTRAMPSASTMPAV